VRRIDDALDRRLAATIDAERDARRLTDEHSATLKQRQHELKEIDQRIAEARALLAEAQHSGDELTAERTALEHKLQSLAVQDMPSNGNGTS
jgi:hypothetical protein